MSTRLRRSLLTMAVGAGALATGTLGCKPAIQTISNATSKQNPTFGIPITENGMGSISGKATLDGENIVTGRVLFFFEKGPCLAVGVIDNGQYSAEGLAEGPCEMVVLLDPKGSMPAPFGNVQGGGSSAGKMKPGGGAGQPKGFPGGPPGPGGPQGPGAPPIPGGPGMKTPPGMPDNGAMPEPPQALPAPFLEMLKFQIPDKSAALYTVAHKKYGKTSAKNPLKVRIASGTVYDLKLTTK